MLSVELFALEVLRDEDDDADFKFMPAVLGKGAVASIKSTLGVWLTGVSVAVFGIFRACACVDSNAAAGGGLIDTGGGGAEVGFGFIFCLVGTGGSAGGGRGGGAEIGTGGSAGSGRGGGAEVGTGGSAGSGDAGNAT